MNFDEFLKKWQSRFTIKKRSKDWASTFRGYCNFTEHNRASLERSLHQHQLWKNSLTLKQTFNNTNTNFATHVLSKFSDGNLVDGKGSKAIFRIRVTGFLNYLIPTNAWNLLCSCRRSSAPGSALCFGRQDRPARVTFEVTRSTFHFKAKKQKCHKTLSWSPHFASSSVSLCFLISYCGWQLWWWCLKNKWKIFFKSNGNVFAALKWFSSSFIVLLTLWCWVAEAVTDD